jgi:hypothetical protein
VISDFVLLLFLVVLELFVLVVVVLFSVFLGLMVSAIELILEANASLSFSPFPVFLPEPKDLFLFSSIS